MVCQGKMARYIVVKIISAKK